MRRFGIVGFLIGALLLGGVGLTAYQMGVNEGTTSAAVDAGATVVYMQGGGGFPFLGVLFGLLFIGFVVSLFTRAAWRRAGGPGFGPGFGPGRGPWGGHGPGGWGEAGDRPVPPPFDAVLGRWHCEAHGATGPTTASTPPTSPAPSAGTPPADPVTGEPKG